LAKRILEDAGIGGERLEMFNMSAAMGPRFAAVAREMTERIRKLGPSPIKRTNGMAQSAESKKLTAHSK
jgi:F420-non-reducing hydrogenase iron-sulfur subunit